MKFSCTKEGLLAVLLQISRAIAVKPASPALGGIYMKVDGGMLELQANNYSLGMIATINVHQMEGGEVVVIGKKFLDIVRVIHDDDNAITFEYKENDNCVEISSNNFSYSVATYNVDDFPKVVQREGESTFSVKAAVLKNLIKKTVWSCIQDESHQLYCGCLLETDEDLVTVVGTNMHRVSIATGKLLNRPNPPLRVIIHRDSMRTIAELLPDDDKTEITVDYTGRNISFTIDEIFLTTRLIEGNFPEYRRTIPESSASIVLADVDELRGALERISIISREDPNKKVSFKFLPDRTEIYANSLDFGSGSETIATSLKGPNLNISFNNSYIIDALKVLRSGSCRLGLNGSYDSLDLREQGNDDYIYIVTPVRG